MELCLFMSMHQTIKYHLFFDKTYSTKKSLWVGWVVTLCFVKILVFTELCLCIFCIWQKLHCVPTCLSTNWLLGPKNTQSNYVTSKNLKNLKCWNLKQIDSKIFTNMWNTLTFINSYWHKSKQNNNFFEPQSRFSIVKAFFHFVNYPFTERVHSKVLQTFTHFCFKFVREQWPPSIAYKLAKEHPLNKVNFV